MVPKLSIITVNYNNASGLKKTIESVINQDLRELEFIVIDGNSTDGSIEILKEYDKYIEKWLSELDTGVYSAMNKGISYATGEYVLFLNSGDHFFNKNTIKDSIKYIKEFDILAFDIFVEGDGDSYVKSHPQNLSFSYLFNDTLAHQSTVIKRSVFDKVGKYDEELEIVSDWKFFVDAIVRFNCTYQSVPKTLTHYYLDGMSATAAGTFTRREERKQILNDDYAFFYSDYKKLNLLKSNRFKLLDELELSKTAQKLNSLWLRILLRLFRNKSLKDL